MKLRIRSLALLACAAMASGGNLHAAVYPIAISPPASMALNLGTKIYPGDHAPGLSALNESNQPASLATGGALGPMTYDDVSKLLTIDYGYGSFYGFTDLVGNWTDTHIHGNGTDTAKFPALNTDAGVTIFLAPSHVAQGPKSGRVTTSVTLTPTQETWLFDNQLYFNVHSTTFAPGEIRGQIVIIPEPTTLALACVAGAGLLAFRRRHA